MTDPTNVPRSLRVAAAYGWRILIVFAVLYVILSIVAKLQLVLAALFVALVLAALLGPWVRVLDKFLPRILAVILGFLTLLAALLGIVAFITQSVAGEWAELAEKFRTGVGEIELMLVKPPFNLSESDIVAWYDGAGTWLSDNRGMLVNNALGSFSTVVEVFAVLALGVFCAACFLVGGTGIWNWILNVFPVATRSRVDGAGQVAWRAFAGYTRGIIIVAITNAILVGILLLILGVPLALPLALLVFFGTFIPLIGAPIAMIIAAVVALAAKGPVIAIIVLIGIFLLGQFEGNVVHPIVMAKAVNLHPLVVALSVACGTLLAGLLGAVLAVPIVSVAYGVTKFWIQTAPPPELDEPRDPTGVVAT